MTLNEFQQLASRTLPEEGKNHFFKITTGGTGYKVIEDYNKEVKGIDLIHALFGLAGEVGEMVDPVKRAMFYGKELDTQNIKEEAGDLMWYIAGPLCRALGCTLEELCAANVDKLKKRYPEKYSDQDALARADKGDEGLILVPQMKKSVLQEFSERAELTDAD